MRLARNGSGAVAIEFAVAMPLILAFFIAIIDLTLLYITDAALLNGVVETTRKLRTGELSGNASETTFKTEICTAAANIDCTNMVLDVRSFTKWSDVNWPAPIDANNDGIIDNFSYSPGGSSAVSSNTFSITTVRASVTYSFITPGMEYFFGRTTGIPLVHTAVVVVEPYNP